MAETKDDLASMKPELVEIVEDCSQEKPFSMVKSELTDIMTDEDCSKEGTECKEEDGTLENKYENVFVPIQTEIFLSDTEMDDDIDENIPAGVDPLEADDPTEVDNEQMDIKIEKVVHLDLPEVNDPKDVGNEQMDIKIVKVEHLHTPKTEVIDLTEMTNEEMSIKIEKVEHLDIPKTEESSSHLQKKPATVLNANGQTETIIRLVKLTFVRNVPAAGSPHSKSIVQGNIKSRPGGTSLLPNYEVVKYGVDNNQVSQNSLQRTLYRCNRCRSLFLKLIQVQRHMCPPVQETFNCDLSKVTTPESLSLKNQKKLSHVESILKKPPFMKAKVMDGLKDGWKTQLTCADCGKTFSKKASLTVHMISHASVDVFQCDICLRRCSNRGNLADHKKKCGRFRYEHKLD